MGIFQKLANSQMDTYKVINCPMDYDEDKIIDIAIRSLSFSYEVIISFDKIKPSFIFFHEGCGQNFSILSTCSPDDKEYKDLLELRTIPVIIQNKFNHIYQIKEEKLEIPKELDNYRKFTSEMFYREIKKILNINKYKNEYYKGLKSIEEIVGEYVFTADNFIKMILILLHIRENIPVIMMGETGCGKTSLIRKLSELINNGESNMKILNIHAGITEQDLVDFLYKPRKKDNKDIPSIIEEVKVLEENEKEKKRNMKEMI